MHCGSCLGIVHDHDLAAPLNIRNMDELKLKIKAYSKIPKLGKWLMPFQLSHIQKPCYLSQNLEVNYNVDIKA